MTRATVLGMAFLIGAATAAPAHPKVFPFDPAGSTATFPTAVTDNKRVTGYFVDDQGKTRGFLRNTNSDTTTAFDPEGSQATHPRAVNSAGAAAGDFTGADGKVHSFLRDAAGNIVPFDTRHGTDTRASAMNDSGTIVGSVTLRGRARGFLRHPDGSVRTFVVSNAPGGTFPASINTVGTIAGYYQDKHSLYHGFIRTGDGTITTFDAPDAFLTAPVQINDDGVVTGSFIGNDEKTHAFVRKTDGGLSTFDVPGTVETDGIGTDDRGNLYGQYTDGSGMFHGFVKHFSGLLVLFDGPDATETFVTAANFRGITVGRFETDQRHGFLRTR